jgi:saccharopine dehydrogenase-like NADP-dependent oxidoreductase
LKALLLGSTGVLGRRVAAELIRSAEVETLLLGGRDPSALTALGRMFGSGDKIQTVLWDAGNGLELPAGTGSLDVVVSCAGPAYVTEVVAARAAVSGGVHYVSLNDEHRPASRVLELHDAAVAAGTTVISGCGLSPGLTDVLAASAATDMDEIEEIEVSVAVSSADDGGPASALHMMASLSGPASFVSEGRYLEGPAGGSPRLVYFPEPVGWVETFRLGHPEVVTLRRVFPDVASLGFRSGLTERAVMDALRAVTRGGLASTDRSRRAWRALTGPVRPLLEKLPPRGAPWTSARVDVWGSRRGHKLQASLAVVDHLANLASVTLAFAALEIGSGRCGKPGVRSAAEVFEPQALLAALDGRGIRAARLEPAVV